MGPNPPRAYASMGSGDSCDLIFKLHRNQKFSQAIRLESGADVTEAEFDIFLGLRGNCAEESLKKKKKAKKIA